MTEPLTKKEKAHRAADRAHAREEAREAAEAPEATPAPEYPPPDGVGDRGVEQGVGFYVDGAGRKTVATPGHPDFGKAW